MLLLVNGVGRFVERNTQPDCERNTGTVREKENANDRESRLMVHGREIVVNDYGRGEGRKPPREAGGRGGRGGATEVEERGTTRNRDEKRRVKEGPLVGRRVKRVGAPYTILAVARLVGKWVYKRGPDDSISTHDPTFIPISTERGSHERTSVIVTRAEKK